MRMAKRRSSGEGSIYRRDDGLWVAQVYLPSGKKKVKHSKSQKVVRDWLQEQKEAISKGAYIDAKEIALQDFLEQYMASASSSLRPKTVESYTYLIRNHIVPELGSYRLTQLRPDMIQAFYTAKVSAGLSNRTVRYMHAILHKALEQAMKWGLVIRNVTDLVDPPSLSRSPQATWNTEQAKRFLEQVKGSRCYPMYCLAFIGLREGEILGLQVEDFDPIAHTISIRHALEYLIGKGLVLTEPKTESGKRTIKLPDFVYIPLKEHRDGLERKQGFLFTTGNGTPFSPRNLFRDFKEQTRTAGLPDIRFHDLRHQAVSFMINVLKIPPSVAQSIVGHASPLLTLGVYTHTSTEIQMDAAERMGELFP